MSKYYTYVCYVNDVVKYVGRGQGSRYKHCTSGKSSCSQLNRDFFEDKSLEVLITHDKLTRQQSKDYEYDIISGIDIENLYNKQLPSRLCEIGERSVGMLKDIILEVAGVKTGVSGRQLCRIFDNNSSKYGNPIADTFYPEFQQKLLMKLGGYKVGTKFKIDKPRDITGFVTEFVVKYANKTGEY